MVNIGGTGILFLIFFFGIVNDIVFKQDNFEPEINGHCSPLIIKLKNTI